MITIGVTGICGSDTYYEMEFASIESAISHYARLDYFSLPDNKPGKYSPW
jgi:hypothetical protein